MANFAPTTVLLYSIDIYHVEAQTDQGYINLLSKKVQFNNLLKQNVM